MCMDIRVLRFYRRKDGFVEVFKQMQSKQNQRMQVLVVPEKFGLSAEKAMFESTRCGASFFMDVTTFDRLADKYVIYKNIQYLSKSAGVMLIQKIAQDIAGGLSVLSKSCSYNGFCENVFNTIMLLKSSVVSPNALNEALGSLQDVSKLKLQDIQKIYDIYEDTIKNRYIDSANKMDILGKELQYDDDNNNIDFYIYSPKITKQILNVCDKLIKKSHSITFMIDNYQDDSIIYDDNFDKIYSLIKANGNKYEENTIQRFDSISTQIKSVGSTKKFTNKNVRCYNLKNIKEEITAVCVDILRKGDRYKDNAILVCDLPKYQTTIQKIFDSYGISHFIDTEQTLLELAPTKFLLQMINIMYEFKVEKVLSIIKSGYFDYVDDEIYNFELYVRKWGINERNFFSDNKPQDELYEDFNKIYDSFCQIFKKLKSDLQKCKIYNDYINVIKQFLVDYDIENKILNECDNLSSIQQIQKSKLFEQVYKKWQTLFDQLSSILGFNTVSIKDFYLVLKAGLNSVQVKTPPLAVDCVYIGQAGTAMIYDYKNVYAIGCIEGAFPTYNQDCGLILDAELDKMRDIAQIDPTIRAVNVENFCNIINNLACTDNLWLSYPISMFFVEQRPATLLNNIKRLFIVDNKEIPFLSYQPLTLLDDPTMLAKDINTSSCAETYIRELYNLKEYNNKQIEYRINGIAKKLNINLHCEEELPQIPRQLKTSSVSQLQVYFDCPYKNFVQYGLKLKENPDNTIKAIDVGNFMHKVAELFGRYLIKNKISFVEDESIFDTICKKSLNEFEYNESGKKGKILDSKQKAIINNLINSAKLMLRAINEQNKLSLFRIVNVEKNISLKISNGEFDTLISGKIDRVDTYNNYVRIIDYKTGNESFNKIDLLSGRRIQLFVYLGALQKLEKLCPVGAYYFKIKDDFTSPYSDKDYLKTYCLNGVTVDTKELILAQDTSLSEDKPSSDIIPVRCSFGKEFKLDGRRAGAYSSEKVQEFIDYALAIFAQGTREIALGNINKSPYDNACKYCSYKGVLCMGNKNCRKIKNIKDNK